MDIKQSLEKKNKRTGRPVLWAASIAAAIICFVALSAPWQQSSIDLTQLTLATVQQGALDARVSGYGSLRSKYTRFLTANYQAQVDEVLLRPGARVETDTVILRLSNPALEQQLNRTRLALARQKASFEALKLSQQSEQLSAQGNFTLLKSELAGAQLRAEAESQLIAEGIVSALDHKRSQLAVKQLSERVNLAEVQMQQMQALHQKRLDVERELVEEFVLAYASAQADVDKLQVRAGIDGMLQELSVEQGQSVQVGAPLAVVGSEHELLADLLVNEREASQIILGQLAVIDTFSGTVEAQVRRIDPLVRDGRVAIELELIGELPSNARPALTIEGEIITDTLEDALYLRRPSFVEAGQTRPLFIVNPSENQLVKAELEFGKLAGDSIELRSAIPAGTQVVISDMGEYMHLQELTTLSN
ncbi:HlyD family secretion protein [Pseudoalteromonas sp. T1lg48]|uniref:HlyD family secretion protein n=1 Tax=Pseudoalteromonas sp. T1lg48 TaxID=2077100 RepID=UPI000CF6E7A4|nr:HlyD family efflux transporter periplasmic adaptor subunit [Pseudoalteromonas sp. T1lg48]